MVIEDLEYDTVTEMLNFIYCGRCLKDVNEFAFASDLLIAADKYRLEELKSHCEKALIQVNDLWMFYPDPLSSSLNLHRFCSYNLLIL